MKRIHHLALIFLCLCPSLSRAAIIYVDSAHAGGTQTGASWATAFQHFQSGIDAAQSGDSVWVAQGTYQPPPGASFQMKEGVKILGGFLNTDTAATQRDFQGNLTVLKGNGNSVIRNDATGLTAAALLDGFTISGGNAGQGGGIYNNYASPRISNCVIKDNAALSGAGLYNRGKLDIRHTTIIGNIAINSTGYSTQGGGIYNIGSAGDTLLHCIIRNNIASTGCGIYNDSSSLYMDYCLVDSNQSSDANLYASGYGGGICNQFAVSLLIRHSRIIANHIAAYNNIYAYGGGLLHWGQTLTIDSCIIGGNKATASQPYGGGIAITGYGPVNITHSTFSGNMAEGANAFGGGIYNWSAATITISDCDITDNMGYTDAVYRCYGGGFYNAGIAPVSLNRCRIARNTAYSSYQTECKGGGIYNAGEALFGINDCSITDNKISTYHFNSYGGGIYNDATAPMQISHSLISRNIAECTPLIFYRALGGGIYHSGDSLELAYCTIRDNKALNAGGGIYIEGSTTVSTISNSIFTADSAKNGAAIYCQGAAPIIAGALLYRNVADSFGAACYNSSSSPRISNSTIVCNRAPGSAIYNTANSAPMLVNTIVWANSGGMLSSGASTPQVTYSLVQGINGSIPEHNIDGNTDPLFADTTAADFSLRFNSPCIDNGHNINVPVTLTNDLAGNNRIENSIVDRGAYEYRFAINLGNDTTICPGDSFMLDARNPGAACLWNTGDTTRSIRISDTGYYSVSVSNSFGTITDTIHIGFKNPPTPDLGNDTIRCTGVLLDAGYPGSSYLWSTGDTTQHISALTPGIYSVKVTGINYCVGYDTINIGLYPLPLIDLGPDTAICRTDTLLLEVPYPGATYLWSDGSVQPMLRVYASGIYSVAVTDGNQCTSYDTLSVRVKARPVVDLGDDITLAQGASAVLNAGNPGSGYLWNTAETTQTITVTQAGTYTVWVTNSENCQTMDSVHILWTNAINNRQAGATAWQVYPNPALESVVISNAKGVPVPCRIRIMDMPGHLLLETSITRNGQRISLANLRPGAYLLQLPDGTVFKLEKR
ncbi:right-handed parallel beta-helix repeat-containing protein [Taibaiella koreensis]|uniref:right-handed parallel beta-helix repeat-containing protein n=1 Tax=Taibaiella koreensis TaxID=1268548 RepID=UPI000E599CAB|nr:right-handed parallel beta-helix repeat-containing protein [Taibaiella koreensis]